MNKTEKGFELIFETSILDIRSAGEYTFYKDIKIYVDWEREKVYGEYEDGELSDAMTKELLTGFSTSRNVKGEPEDVHEAKLDKLRKALGFMEG